DCKVHTNGHIKSNELPRSPSVPSLVQVAPKSSLALSPPGIKSVELRSKPESVSRPDSVQKDVPWLQELRQNQQRKKVSGVFNTDDSMSSSGPAACPKPVTPPQKHEDKSPAKVTKHAVQLPESSVPDAKAKPSEPQIPNPDYESASSQQIIPPRHKPQPRPPVAGIPFERKSDTTSSPVIEVRKATETRKTTTVSLEHKKPTPSSEINKAGPQLPKELKEADNQMDDKINAIQSNLLSKIKLLEDRIEENRKQHSHSIQMLMSELDEERKKRACMEVEIERLKKLVIPYAQV
ncbi:hypothetical protein SK128_022583, partial [Halocaridina rubra]